MNKQTHTRENAKAEDEDRKKEIKKTQRPNARIAKSAVTPKQAQHWEKKPRKPQRLSARIAKITFALQNTMYFAFQQT